MLDARIVATGTIGEYTSPDPRLDLALADGSVGGQALEWARKRWQLPGTAMPRPPVTLTSGRVQRAGGSGAPLSVQAAVGLAAGVRAEFDLASEAGHLDVRRLAVKDSDTDTVLSLKWVASTAEVGVQRHARQPHARAGVRGSARRAPGALRGNFRATIDLAEPRRSSAEGSLEGERIDILQSWDIPVAIERVRIDVAGDAVQIRDGVFMVAGERLDVAALVTSQPKTFGLDLRVLPPTRSTRSASPRAFPRGEAKPAGRWNLPVDGRVTVDAKSIAYGTHVFRPVSGRGDARARAHRRGRQGGPALRHRAAAHRGDSARERERDRPAPDPGAAARRDRGVPVWGGDCADRDGGRRRDDHGERARGRARARGARHVPVHGAGRPNPQGTGDRAHPRARGGLERAARPAGTT